MGRARTVVLEIVSQVGWGSGVPLEIGPGRPGSSGSPGGVGGVWPVWYNVGNVGPARRCGWRQDGPEDDLEPMPEENHPMSGPGHEGGMAKFLAVDWGRSMLGLAVSDDLGVTAQGLVSLQRKGEAQDVEAIGAHIQRLGIEAIVVGFPKNMDGSLGPSAEAAQAFAQALHQRLHVPVHLWD